MSKKKQIGRGRQMTAYGKTMSLADWSRSKYCRDDVSHRCLIERTRDSGWSLEKSLTTKPKKLRSWTQRQEQILLDNWDDVAKVSKMVNRSCEAVRAKKYKMNKAK